MTNQEFINEFDILYNNIMSNQAPGLDEYEKSVYLTLAQEQVIKELYSGTLKGFEGDEETRRYIHSSVNEFIQDLTLAQNDVKFNINPDIWYITLEKVINTEDKELPVIPLKMDFYHEFKNNPFRLNKNRVYRIDSNNNEITLLSTNSLKEYKCFYIKKPEPIILIDLSDTNLSINGVNTETECKLHPMLHRTILQYAVQLAYTTYKK